MWKSKECTRNTQNSVKNVITGTLKRARNFEALLHLFTSHPLRAGTDAIATET